MKKIKKTYHKWKKHPRFKYYSAAAVFLLIVLAIIPINFWNHSKKNGDHTFTKHGQPIESHWLDLQRVLDNSFEMDSPYWPMQFFSSKTQYQIDYTFDWDLTNFLKELIQRHPSDFTSIVVLDNATGDILAAIDHERKANHFDKRVTFSATSPAASLFKVITAANVIQNRNISSVTPFSFHGRKTTLYRTQLSEGRHEREVLFKRAFAESNNVVFGRAAQRYSDSWSLFKTAENFGFNRSLIDFLDPGKSFFPMAESEYNLAELGSGLNTLTMISPVHAAKIAAIIANGGHDLPLRVVNSIEQTSNGAKLYAPQLRPSASDNEIISSHTAAEIQIMMEETVQSGTARMIRRKMNRRLFSKLKLGGKTGQMTGGIPMGKRDWLILYAKPKDNKDLSHDKGISLAIMLVNQEHWYVRPMYLAIKVLEHMYADLN